MTQLDLMTQQNAAMTEDSAAASESLKMLSTSLAACMAEFTTLPGPTQPARDHPAPKYKNKSVQ